MLNYKKVIKIFLISILSVLLLLIISIMLLFIFFPSELIRKEIEKQASGLLQTEVKLEKLKLSVFRGIELGNLSIKQFGKRWKDEYIIKLNKAYLKYNLLPLIFKRELSVKACVLESGVINLEKNRNGSNWDHFMNIFNAMEKEAGNSGKDIKINKVEKTKITKDSIPIDLNLKKVGVEDISLNYTDKTFFDIPLIINLKDVTLLAKNIKLKDNKPFNLTSKVSLGIDGGEYISLDSFIKSNGKLKIFDDQSSEIYLNGPIKIDLIKTRFASKLFKDLVVKFIEDLIGKIVGPELEGFFKDKNFILQESDLHFKNILDNSGGIINKEIERANKIFEKKKNFIEYKTEILNDFEKQLNTPLTEIDVKIDNIDYRITPIINTASRIPLVENFVNLNKYRDKIRSLKLNSEKYRDNIKNKYKNNLENELMTIINDAVPGKVPTFNEYEKEFANRVEILKNNFAKNIGNFSISSLIGSYIPELTFIDKGFDILNLSTVYYLNRKESKSEDFKFKSKYFNINGDFIKKNKEIDFTGFFDLNNELLNLDIFPVKNLKTKVKVSGELKDLNVKILEFPELKIDSDKLKDAAISIIQKFLNKKYSDNIVISEVLKKFQIMDINEKELKNIFLEKKDINFNKLINEKNTLLNSIDKNVDDIIDELKGRVPGL